MLSKKDSFQNQKTKGVFSRKLKLVTVLAIVSLGVIAYTTTSNITGSQQSQLVIAEEAQNQIVFSGAALAAIAGQTMALGGKAAMLGGMASKIGGLTKMAGGLTSTVSGAMKTVSGMSSAFGKVTGAVNKIGGVVDTAQNFAKGDIGAGLSGLSQMGQMGGRLSGLQKLTGGLAGLQGKGSLAGIAGQALGGLTSGQGIGQIASGVAGGLMDKAGLGGLAGGLTKSIGAFSQGGLGGLASSLVGGSGGIGSLVSKVPGIGGIASVVSSVGKGGVMGAAMKGLNMIGGGKIMGIANTVSGLFGSVSSMFGGGQPESDPEAMKMLGGLQEGQQKIMGGMKNTQNNIMQGAKKLDDAIKQSGATTRKHIHSTGQSVHKNLNHVKQEMYQAIDNMKGIQMETRRAMKKKLDENLEATIKKIDASTKQIEGEIRQSTEKITGRLDGMQNNINSKIADVEKGLSDQMTNMGMQVNKHIKNTVGAFKKEVIHSLDQLKSEMKDSFDQSSGNQEIIKEDLSELKENMMKNLEYAQQAHYGRVKLLQVVTNFEEAIKDLQSVTATKSKTDKEYYIKALKERLNANEYKMSDATIYLKPAMMLENIKMTKKADLYQATLQANTYKNLIACMHSLETMRVTFNLDAKTAEQAVIDSELERNDANYVERMDGLGFIIASELTTGPINEQSQSSGHGTKLVGKGKVFTKTKKTFSSTMKVFNQEALNKECVKRVAADSSCQQSYFTTFHSGSHVACYCLPKNSGKPALKSDGRVDTYQITAAGASDGFTVSANICQAFPLPAAHPKILAKCSSYHKKALKKYDEARNACSSKMDYFTNVLSSHFNKQTKYREDSKTCAISDGETIDYCACVTQMSACHVKVNYISGKAKSMQWFCEGADE